MKLPWYMKAKNGRIEFHPLWVAYQYVKSVIKSLRYENSRRFLNS